MPPEPSTARLVKDAYRVLNNPFWIPTLSSKKTFTRIHDDNDGTPKGQLTVSFSEDGDAWVWTDGHRGPALRFRTSFGGGRSPRTRNALILLALAIKLDNKEHPIEVLPLSDGPEEDNED